MRVNVYAEEMTDRIEIIKKEIDGHSFTGLRFYLYLPATDADGVQHQGPFMHRPGDDDSAAVTFWGKQDLRKVLRQALEALDEHYACDDEFRFAGGARMITREDGSYLKLTKLLDSAVKLSICGGDAKPEMKLDRADLALLGKFIDWAFRDERGE